MSNFEKVSIIAPCFDNLWRRYIIHTEIHFVQPLFNMEERSGITLESIVIATRTAQAIKRMAARGIVRESNFPLLMYVDQIINHDMPVQIPWGLFEVEYHD